MVSNWRKDLTKCFRFTLKWTCTGAPQAIAPAATTKWLSQYKFYLAFDNLHPRCITEKPWKNALQAWTATMVLSPSRKSNNSCSQYLHPPHSFQSPKELARYLLVVDKDHTHYPSYFRWQETLQPPSCRWGLIFFEACWRLHQESSHTQ